MDGSSNTILVGERSTSRFHSTWTGVIFGSDKGPWHLVGWTGETPNFENDPQQEQNPIDFAQFNSTHAGDLAMFGFADGSIRTLSKNIDLEVFHAMGTISGRDN